MESVVEEWLMKKYEGVLLRIARIKKEDLKMVGPEKHAQRTFTESIIISLTIYWDTGDFIYNFGSAMSATF